MTTAERSQPCVLLKEVLVKCKRFRPGLYKNVLRNLLQSRKIHVKNIRAPLIRSTEVDWLGSAVSLPVCIPGSTADELCDLVQIS